MKRVFGLSVSHLVCDLYSPVLPAVLPLLMATYGYPYFTVGLLITAFQLTSSISQPVLGWLHDTRGLAVHVSVPILMSAAGMSLIGVAGAYPLLIVCALISGLGHALFHPSALAVVSGLAAGESRGRITSFFVVGGNLGFALGPLVAGVLLAWAGLSALLLLLVPGIAMAIVLRALLPAPDHHPRPAGVEDDDTDSPPLPVGPLAILVTASALRAWAIFGSVAYLPAFLTLRGYDIGMANALVSGMLICGVVGQVTGGAISDRHGRKEYTIAGLVACLPALALFLATGGILSIAGLFLFGFFLWSTFSVTLAMGHEMLPSRVGLISGLMLGFAVGTGGAGVALSGWIADALTLNIALEALAAPIIVALVLFAILPYPWKALGRRFPALK
ncbi:MAG: MFS transporter [Methanomicrobiales archaeon]